MTKRQSAPGGLELVREFVNTLELDTGADELRTAKELRRWLADHGLAAPATKVTRADLARATEFREALRAILLAHNQGTAPPRSATRTLDELSRPAQLELRFDESCVASVEPSAGGVDGALGRLLVVVHAAIRDGTWVRLKACREPTCVWAFYDNTKNRSGAWCTMEVCGNRAKARAYRDRRTATPAR